MNDLAQFQPAFNGVNTLLAVSTNIETEQITNGNLKLKGNSSFQIIQRLQINYTKILKLGRKCQKIFHLKKEHQVDDVILCQLKASLCS
jgi:hypothetical protein